MKVIITTYITFIPRFIALLLTKIGIYPSITSAVKVPLLTAIQTGGVTSKTACRVFVSPNYAFVLLSMYRTFFLSDSVILARKLSNHTWP